MKTKEPPNPAQSASGRRNIVAFNQSRGSRPALKSGVGSAMATGEIPDGIPGREEIERQVEEIIGALVTDLGGPESVTAGQQIIISGLRLSLIVQGLSEAYILSTGVINRKTKKPHSLLKIAATYVNSARLGALALGLERHARPVNDLDSIALEYAEIATATGRSTEEKS